MSIWELWSCSISLSTMILLYVLQHYVLKFSDLSLRPWALRYHSQRSLVKTLRSCSKLCVCRLLIYQWVFSPSTMWSNSTIWDLLTIPSTILQIFNIQRTYKWKIYTWRFYPITLSRVTCAIVYTLNSKINHF